MGQNLALHVGGSGLRSCALAEDMLLCFTSGPCADPFCQAVRGLGLTPMGKPRGEMAILAAIGSLLR